MEEVRHLLWNHAAACSRRSDSRNAGFRWWARVKGETGGGGTSLPSFFSSSIFCLRSTRKLYSSKLFIRSHDITEGNL